MGARAWPFGCLCPSPERLGLRNSLRSNSPRPQQSSGLGRSLARRRLRWRHGMARVGMPLNKGGEYKDTGFLHSFGLVHLLDCGMILMVYLHPNHAPPVNGAWKAEGAGRKDASGVQP